MLSPFELSSHQLQEVQSLVREVGLEAHADPDIVSERLWSQFRQSVDFGDFTFEQIEIEFYKWHRNNQQLGVISVHNAQNQAS